MRGAGTGGHNGERAGSEVGKEPKRRAEAGVFS